MTKLASRSISVESIRENRTSNRSFSTPSMTQDNRCSHTLSSGGTQEEWELKIESSLFFSVMRIVCINTVRIVQKTYLFEGFGLQLDTLQCPHQWKYIGREEMLVDVWTQPLITLRLFVLLSRDQGLPGYDDVAQHNGNQHNVRATNSISFSLHWFVSISMAWVLSNNFFLSIAWCFRRSEIFVMARFL